MFEFEDDLSNSASIKVIGVGGGGGNAVRTMIKAKLDGVEFIVANTDVQALRSHESMVKVQLGAKLTKGLGAGSNPEVGRDAALEDIRTIQEALTGSDLVFITAGLGGGTGTGAAPVIARVAKEIGALTVGVVTMPFAFEGKKRRQKAEMGVQELKQEVDTLITIPNEKLLTVAGKETAMLDTFKMADNILLQAVKGISDLITIPGLINLDFADVRTVMSETGMALMGTGSARGASRAIEAAKAAISSPLLENVSIAGARGLLLNITGSSNMTLFEVNEASKLIQEEAHEEANIIFGAVIDDKMDDEMRVTVIATGFAREEKHKVVEVRSHEVRIHEDRNDRSEKNNPPRIKSWGDYQKSTRSTDGRPGDSRPTASSLMASTEVEEQRPIMGRTGRLTEDLSRPAREAASAGSISGEVATAESAPRRREFAGGMGEQELKKIVAEIGIPDVGDEEYDVPAFIRRRAD